MEISRRAFKSGSSASPFCRGTFKLDFAHSCQRAYVAGRNAGVDQMARDYEFLRRVISTDRSFPVVRRTVERARGRQLRTFAAARSTLGRLVRMDALDARPEHARCRHILAE